MFELARWLGSTPLSAGIVSVRWLPQVLLTLHMLTVGVVFGAVLMLVLRLHARARADEPFEQTWRRLAPWFWRALLVMLLTGILLFICEPLREVSALSFWLKMLLIITGAFGMHRLRRPDATPQAAKLVLAVWIAVILLARAIGYDLTLWGALSLKHYL